MDLFYVAASNTMVTLTEEESRSYKVVIEVARRAKYKRNFPSNWHICEDVLSTVCGESEWSILTIEENSKDKDSKKYISTIKNYNYIVNGSENVFEETDEILSKETVQLLQGGYRVTFITLL